MFGEDRWLWPVQIIWDWTGMRIHWLGGGASNEIGGTWQFNINTRLQATEVSMTGVYYHYSQTTCVYSHFRIGGDISARLSLACKTLLNQSIPHLWTPTTESGVLLAVSHGWAVPVIRIGPSCVLNLTNSRSAMEHEPWPKAQLQGWKQHCCDSALLQYTGFMLGALLLVRLYLCNEHA